MGTSDAGGPTNEELLNCINDAVGQLRDIMPKNGVSGRLLRVDQILWSLVEDWLEFMRSEMQDAGDHEDEAAERDAMRFAFEHRPEQD